MLRVSGGLSALEEHDMDLLLVSRRTSGQVFLVPRFIADHMLRSIGLKGGTPRQCVTQTFMATSPWEVYETAASIWSPVPGDALAGFAAALEIAEQLRMHRSAGGAVAATRK